MKLKLFIALVSIVLVSTAHTSEQSIFGNPNFNIEDFIGNSYKSVPMEERDDDYYKCLKEGDDQSPRKRSDNRSKLEKELFPRD